MNRRRILTEFRLDKIAAVDRPCQEHATMTIMKRSPDEVLFIDKREFRKSSVGEAVFAILKAQIAQIASNERMLKEASLETFHMDEPVPAPGPGEAELVAMQNFIILLQHLKQSMGDAGEAEAEAKRRDPEGHRAWKAHKECLKMNVAKAAAEGFEKAVDAIRTRDACSHVEALQKARAEFPSAFAKYQEDGQAAHDTTIAKVEAELAQPKRTDAELAFLNKVDEVGERHSISNAEAMSRTRARYPDLYKAAYLD